MPTLKMTVGDFVAVSMVRFNRLNPMLGSEAAKASLRPSDPKPVASAYLHSTFPEARIRRVLGSVDDATFLVQQPLMADVRHTLNEVVKGIDAMPFLLSSKTDLGCVAYAEDDGDDDGLLNFLHMEGPAEAGLKWLAEATPGKIRVLEAINLLGPQASHLTTVRLEDAETYYGLATRLSAMVREGALLRAVYY